MKGVFGELYKLKGITIDETLRHEKLLKNPFTAIFSLSTAPSVWNNQNEFNEIFLRCHERYFNDLLNVQGYVFLNEVLENLGMKRTKIGQLYGWTLKNSDYISFGYIDEFIKFYENHLKTDKMDSIQLHFNCELEPIIDAIF